MIAREILKSSGEILDEQARSSRWLWQWHVALGLASAFVYWVIPGTFVPRLHTARTGDGILVIIRTIVAWAPFVISGLFSRGVLVERPPRAILVFLTFTTVAAIGATCLYLNVFKIQAAPSPYWVSTGVTAAFMLIALICAAVWKPVTANHISGL